jgi:hypothetical protein
MASIQPCFDLGTFFFSFHGLFSDAFGIENIALNGRIVYELERIWKEGVVA